MRLRPSLQHRRQIMLTLQEVAQLLREGESDIMADPLLQEACALDLQSHCSHIPEGHGRSKGFCNFDKFMCGIPHRSVIRSWQKDSV